MADIKEIIGFNEASDQDSQALTNEIFVIYGNDLVKVSSGTGYSFNLHASSTSSFERFLNTIFFQNYLESSSVKRPKTYDVLQGKWTNRHVNRCVNAKFMKNFKSRLYLGYCYLGPPQTYQSDYNTLTQRNIFPSRIYYSDLFSGNELTWGIEWGSNGRVVPNSNLFELANPIVQNFVSTNIKVGDPIFFGAVSSGAEPIDFTTNQYLVTSVESPLRLRLNKKFPSSVNNAVGVSYWVGSNWFDVSTDDGDSITGIGENSDRLLVFKLFTLWTYTGSQLKQARGSLGTSSHRSIINDRKGYTYYFHGSDSKLSGIYRFDGVSSIKISRGIDPFIAGMDTDNYTEVVAWEEGDELRFYLGDLSNTNHSISMTNAVATINTATNSWDVSPINDVIRCATTFKVGNRQSVYTGTSDNQILQMADGNSFNGSPINVVLETKVYYPSGTDVNNTFPSIQVIGRQTKGMTVQYKLWNAPKLVDDQWKSLGELDADKTELNIPSNHNWASGIQLRLVETGVLENDMLVEKITVFYRPESTRVS